MTSMTGIVDGRDAVQYAAPWIINTNINSIASTANAIPCFPPLTPQIPWTFLYEGGFMVRCMTLAAYVGISDMAPMAATRQ